MYDDNDLFEQTNRGKEIFEHYLGHEIQLKKNYHSILREERTPSMSFYKSKNNVWRLKDFGSDNVGPIELVMRMFNLHYTDAVKKIREDLRIEGNVIKRVYSSTPLKPIIKEDISRNPDEPKFRITFREIEWEQDDHIYWNSQRITRQLIEELGEKVIPIRSYTLVYNDPNKKDVTVSRSKHNQLLYAYVETDLHGQERIKIYNPLATDRRFKWLGNTNGSTIQGWKQLKYKAKFLIINSSKKDYLSLQSMVKEFCSFTVDTIAPNAEGTLLDGSVIVHLKTKYDYIFTFLDWDDAGIHFSKVYESRHCIKPLNHLLREYNVKDIAKLAEYASDEEIREFMENFSNTLLYESE